MFPFHHESPCAHFRSDRTASGFIRSEIALARQVNAGSPCVSISSMSWNRYSRKAGERVRFGRRVISVPSVPSMTDADRPAPASGPASGSERQPAIDRNAVQYLDRVRAIFRPTSSDKLAPGLERFIGREDIFRHVGTGSDGEQPMMQCPVHWPSGVRWVPIGDLEILEDQDVRAG